MSNGPKKAGSSIGPRTLKEDVRATPIVSQNWEQKPFLNVKGAKIWLLNSDKPNLTKYS